MTKKVTALVLQGGAALGAYEFGVIKALHESGIHPEIITGVSIGSYNAAVLGGYKGNSPLDALEYMWCELFAVGGLTGCALKMIPFDRVRQMFQLLGNKNVYSINAKSLIPFLSSTSIYDNDRVRRSLEMVIDFDRLNRDDSPHVVVNAVDIKEGTLTHFDNRDGHRLRVEHLLASSSIAPLSPTTVIRDKTGKSIHYWDGAFINNTPLSKAIHLLQEYEDSSTEKIERQIIIAELFPKKSQKVPENMEQVIDRIVELMASSKVELDLKQFDRTSSNIDLIRQIDQHLPHDEIGEKIRSLSAYRSLLHDHKKIDRKLVVTLQDEESVLSVLDFSKDAIDRRINSGYLDTILALNSSGHSFVNNSHKTLNPSIITYEGS